MTEERIETRGPSLALRLGAGAEPAFAAAAQRAGDERWIERLFDRDASLWSTDPRVQAAISERLGWLDAPGHFTEQIPALEAFGDATRDRGFTAAILAGMGGSSLAADVINRTFGTSEDWLTLRVLDSTDPESVAATVDDLYPLSTALHRFHEVGHDHRDTRLPGGCVGARRARHQGGRRSWIARPVHDRDERPREGLRSDPAERRVPRGVPGPCRCRRSLVGADERGPRAGLTDRPGSRSVPRGRDGDAGAVHNAGPAGESRRSRSGSPSGRLPRPAGTS